ncbi:hypothetical protein LWI29_028369 [Acer saccharum]|uniref:Retrovirus-related Pol polyprotein from transposon TNT 1-94-like beta-barrel domain-containing protein n=1 Tax=Acer saccharum TaxID=4024 RepID=A0AA39RIT0_ACESA|nr:hypothetical protein LWI29_028369 [Acer saccharum]
MELLCVMFWSMWWRCNQVIHHAAARCEEDILCWAIDFVSDFQAVYVTTVGSVVPRQSMHVLWKNPTQGWFKGNTDAATRAQVEVDGGDVTATAVRRLSNDGKCASSSLWYIDSMVSNHMTSSLAPFANVKPYVGNMQIRTVNGETLPIKSVGDIPYTLPLTNVFHALDLTSFLIFVGQLVDENCNVSFSKSGCVVQDQDSGKVIGKGPKCGRLFSLSLPNYPRNKNLFSFFSLTSSSSSKM